MKPILTLLGEIDQNDLQFVRERFGNPVVAIPAPYTKNKDGSYKQINPHESRFILENGKTASVFHIKPAYYATPIGTWRPLYEVASYYGNKRGMTLKSGWENKIDMGYLAWYIKRLESMKSQYGVAVSYPQTFAGIELSPVQIPVLLNVDNITVYPDPHAETNTVDGRVQHYTNNLTWAQIIAGTGTGVYDSGSPITVIEMDSYGNQDTWSTLDRGIFLFKISSIPVGVTLNTTTFSLYGSAKADQFSPAITPNVNIYSSAPASNTVLAAGDFDSLGTSAYCDTAIIYDNWSTVGYNAFAFNSNPGMVAVQAAYDGTGILKLGTRNANYDVSGTPPTWSGGNSAYLSSYYAETADTTSDPKLYVEYTGGASGPANLKSLNGNLLANIKTINQNAIANCKSLNTNT